MPKLLRLDNDCAARFITFGTYKRYPILTDPAVVSLLLKHVAKLRRMDIKLIAYVVMPNHVHLVLLPPTGTRSSRVIGQMKGRVAHEVFEEWKNAGKEVPRALCTPNGTRVHTLWQKRCYDRHIRNGQELREVMNYCHANPVRAGLTRNPGEWPWSSYNWYEGKREGVIPIDDSVL